eukprot:5217840-Amphidinium_carterae.1
MTIKFIAVTAAEAELLDANKFQQDAATDAVVKVMKCTLNSKPRINDCPNALIASTASLLMQGYEKQVSFKLCNRLEWSPIALALCRASRKDGTK